MACSEDCINVRAFFRHFEDGVEIASEVSPLVLPFLAVAGAKANGDDGAAFIEDGGLHFIQDKEFVELLDAVDDVARAAVVEDGSKFLCSSFQKGRLAAASGDGVIVCSRDEIPADDILDAVRCLFALGGTGSFG